jgi:phage tail-like protein
MQAQRIARLLPHVFRSTMREKSLLSGLVDVMADQHRPCEQALDHIDEYYDPRRAPDEFVPFLAGWVHFDHLYDAGNKRLRGAAAPAVTSLGHLRELVACAAFLAKWRGTVQGTLRFLETATGLNGFRIEEPSGRSARPFHIRVIAPEAAKSQAELVHKVIRMAKPAHVSYDLIFSVTNQTKDKP